MERNLPRLLENVTLLSMFDVPAVVDEVVVDARDLRLAPFPFTNPESLFREFALMVTLP